MTGQDHRSGRTARQHGASFVGRQQGGPDGRPFHRATQVSGLPAREVDQVRLAERLRRRGIIRVGAITDEHRFHLGTEPGKMRHPHRSPALEYVLPVGK